jgi:hypothetical protein
LLLFFYALFLTAYDLFKLLQTTTIDEAVKISKIPRRTIYRRLNKIKTILIENNFEL